MSPITFFRKAYYKVMRKQIVRDLDDFCTVKNGRALLYYKTDSLVFRSVANNPSHVNHWEIIEIVRVLNRLGFVVDVIDRTVKPETIASVQDIYQIFIGIGAGDSGRHYADIAKKVPSAKKVFYALGPEPDESNRITLARYDYFWERHPGVKVEIRRTINHVDIDECMKHTDAILSCGSEFALHTFDKHHKPVYKLPPSSSTLVQFPFASLEKKDAKKFLYFGGNGNIVKGLDIVIEAFAELPDYELFICAPQTETDFNAFYKETLEKSKNIHFVGFIKIGGETFYDLTSKCGYVIFPSASEGAATSVTTCMRAGMIPVVTVESGIDSAERCGHVIGDIHISALKDLISKLAHKSKEEVIQKSLETYKESYSYSQGNFSQTLELSLISILRS
ncbi:MAG: hypothetical protein A3B90_00305 [Candidatus Magasanikbacteria bacterium RIFCSPHIGHO2_02_FULL_41_13]|uniref:Glycosyl transferase family 1 domain-containing protein n=1 Tax=Candidatus Magasanikbacteria bacterium RIFCSPHIGHO2_02_FULL_41_13 TaxID=1798676 RepID=A0A1F6M476_9BACT|nr:MAG: hypothetical protein A3B90_00305 [Candidatus Magasanikbacteria bacterium RIFCSPHIGHO2_02_FULL_41_13]